MNARRAVAAAVALVTALRLGAAVASGLSAPNVGSAWSTPTRIDATAVYWNPAALAFVERAEVLVTGGAVVLGFDYTRERRARYQAEGGLRFALPVPADEIDAAKSGRAAPVGGVGGLPNLSVFAAVPLPKRTALGFGLYVPAGAALDLPRGGAQRWALQSVSLAVLHVAASVAWRPIDAFAFGASAQLVVGRLDLRKEVDLAGTSLLARAFGDPPISQPNDFGAAAPPAVRELSVLSRPVLIRDAWAVSAAFNVGFMWQVAPAWRVAAAYQQSVPMRFAGRFSLDMNNDFFTRDLEAQGLKYPPIVRGKGFVAQTLPGDVRVGVRWNATATLTLDLAAAYRLGRFVRSFTATLDSPDLAQPSLGLGSRTTVAIPRRWNDAAEIELSALFAARPLIHGVTLGWHSPQVPDATIDAASPDGHRLIAAYMVRGAVSDRLELFGSAEVQAILPRRVRASDYDLGNGLYALWIAGIDFGVRFGL